VPTLEHGNVQGGGGRYPGTDVTYSCDDGYYMVGEGTASCGTGGTYATPTCSQCHRVEQCKVGFVRCSTASDQHCATPNDCNDGYTKDRHCTGVLHLPPLAFGPSLMWLNERTVHRYIVPETHVDARHGGWRRWVLSRTRCDLQMQPRI
jgi:hypothetical protein